MKILSGVHMTNSIIHLYVHFNISVIRLVVINQVIWHHIPGHQGLPSVHAKLTKAIWDTCKPSWVWYGPRGDKQKNVNFYACHNGLSCVHIMYHRSNTNARTTSWNYYGLFDTKMIRFVADQKFSQVSIWQIALLHLYVHFNISVIRLVVINQVIWHHIPGHQGLPSVHAKLINTIWDAYKLSWVWYGPCGDKQKMSIFMFVTTASPVCA